MKIKSGSYSGNGTSQSITGVGFSSSAIIIKGGANTAVITISTMASDATKTVLGATAVFSGGITTIGSDGFSVGSDARVNANGTTYYFVCFFDNSSGDLHVGTYTGNGTSQSPTGCGFAPDFVFVVGVGARLPYFKTSDMPSTTSIPFSSSSVTTAITALGSDGFSVGSNAGVNTNTEAYHYLAIKSVANLSKTVTYNGNGADDRSITGVGFTPDNVIVKVAPNTTVGAARFKDQASDNSFQLDTTDTAVNKIQAMEADGFQVGTSSSVNFGSGTPAYYAVAFKDTVAPAHAAIPVFMNQYRQRWN